MKRLTLYRKEDQKVDKNGRKFLSRLRDAKEVALEKKQASREHQKKSCAQPTPRKAKCASAPSICASAQITFEKQKVCQRNARARLPSARARKSLLRSRRFASEMRERDFHLRERANHF
ncbi:hypothetical protein JCGZ_22961 [Jatropha curcas]|uniref:Uncharacterized protein n=1 Tax=Jatropha curcas TaxID=180498 RepID=A0A067L5F0_JATCU|nr:hypothetical protein JCGZ_22961 [Jatropha curcas]